MPEVGVVSFISDDSAYQTIERAGGSGKYVDFKWEKMVISANSRRRTSLRPRCFGQSRARNVGKEESTLKGKRPGAFDPNLAGDIRLASEGSSYD